MSDTTDTVRNANDKSECYLLNSDEWELVRTDPVLKGFFEAKWAILRDIGADAQKLIQDYNLVALNKAVEQTIEMILSPFTRLELDGLLSTLGLPYTPEAAKRVADLLARMLLSMSDLTTFPRSEP